MADDTRSIVAANIRARMAWYGISAPALAQKLGWKVRTTQYKVGGHVSITAEELQAVAPAVKASPGELFEILPGFEPPVISGSSSACTRIAAGRHLRLVAA